MESQNNKKVYIAGVLGFIIGFGVCGLIFDGSKSTTPKDVVPSDAATTTDEVMVDVTNDDTEVMIDSEPKDIIGTDAPSSDNPPVSVTIPAQVSGYAVIATDQGAGLKVSIDQLLLEKKSWVAIHDDINGAPAWILGAKRFPQGIHSNSDVTLLRGTLPGNVYYAVIHTDNGDDTFDLKTDLPLSDENGNLVLTRFRTVE